MPTPPLIPVICGTTAGGKSALAVEIALQTTGEIVTADAFQVYRGLDIGTAKPTVDERKGVPHHLIDIVEPGGQGAGNAKFTVDRWLTLAEETIADVHQRGGLPIVVGGTHLYVKMLLEGMFEGPPADESLRAELNALDPAVRREELERVDPAAARRIHPNDVRRTVRALEVFRLTGAPISSFQTQWDSEGNAKTSPYLLVILDWPTEAINRRINARVRRMVELGLVDEARALWQAGKLPGGSGPREALGYKQLVEHFEGKIKNLDDAIEKIKIETRRFAKNQRTWLRRLGTTRGAGGVRLPMGEIALDEATRKVIEACRSEHEGA